MGKYGDLVMLIAKRTVHNRCQLACFMDACLLAMKCGVGFTVNVDQTPPKGFGCKDNDLDCKSRGCGRVCRIQLLQLDSALQ